MFEHGNILIEKIKNTRKLVIISPFIQDNALRKVLSYAPNDSKITVIGRYNKDDIIAGVCDLDAIATVLERNGLFMFCHNLHAKIYLLDNEYFVGSANLSFKGMGWARHNNNIETLINTNDPTIDKLLEVIVSNSYTPSERLITELLQYKPEKIINDDGLLWIPRCIKPEILWSIYNGVDNENDFTRSCAYKDIEYLQIPKFLEKNTFEKLIQQYFIHSEFYKLLFTKIEDNLSDTIGKAWINELANTFNVDGEPYDLWEAVKAWTKRFSKDLFIQPSEEQISKGKQL